MAYLIGISLFIAFMHFDIDTPVLRWLGRISYPLYLIHVPMRQIIVEWMPTLGILATLVLAALMHQFVELPFVNAGKSVIARYPAVRSTAEDDVIRID